MQVRVLIPVMLAAMFLSGCALERTHQLNPPGEGPDEFILVPGKSLQEPDSYTDLPAPTPGGRNRTDATPLQDSVAALGGRRSTDTENLSRGEGAVVGYASRFGRNPDIRTELAAEDAAFRKRRATLSGIRLIRVDNYGRIYRDQALEPQAEMRRWRRAGVRTPSAPPPN